MKVFKWRSVTALTVLWIGLSGPAQAQLPPVVANAVTWMEAASPEQAAEYVAHRMQSFGCVVEIDAQPRFNASVMAHLAASFAMNLPETAPGMLDPTYGAFVRSLNAFGDRAGAVLLDQGRVEVLDNGTAFLTTCRLPTS